MRTICVLLISAGIAVAVPGSVAAQEGTTELEEILEQFSGDNARGYMQPLADLFGANMNSGWFRSAYVPEEGFQLSIELVGMGARVGDDHRSYAATTPAGFEPGTFSTATIFGGPGTVVSHAGNASLSYAGSDGIIDASWFPAAAPQLRIGSLAGTEVIGRFATTIGIDNEDVPTITLWGAGARHSVSQYFPRLPVDLSVGLMYTKLTADELVNFTALTIGAQVGKRLGDFEVYGGGAWERSALDLSYTSTDPSNPGSVMLELDGANSARLTAGGAVNAGFLHLFGEVNVGSVTNFSLGFAVGS
jgi:hypothetical protein